MACSLCQTRKGKRHCPALGRSICPVCCGTKRLVEINCPSDCTYLASAREHPAAVVRRQQEADVASLLPTMAGLTERQHQLFFLFQSVIAKSRPDGLLRLRDSDVSEACAACAATIETEARGVLYEHVPASVPAQKLAGELRALLAQVKEHGATVYDREAAIALRAIEKGARALSRPDARPDDDSAYLTMMGRLLQVNLQENLQEQRVAPVDQAVGLGTGGTPSGGSSGEGQIANRRQAGLPDTGRLILP